MTHLKTSPKSPLPLGEGWVRVKRQTQTPIMISLALTLALAACTPPRPTPLALQPLNPSTPTSPPTSASASSRSARVNTIGIALREWRAFGSIVDDAPPSQRPALADRPDRDPGLWQRVADYWWQSQDLGARQAGTWSSLYNENGTPYNRSAPAWSAAFISYVMRTAGAGARFPYSALHADYINAAARNEGVLHAERPASYPPRPGDLICYGRAGAEALRFDDLPTTRFFGHCDVVVAAVPGQLTVIGGNVSAAVTQKHIPTTQAGTIADPSGQLLDPRYPWFVVLRVTYDTDNQS